MSSIENVPLVRDVLANSPHFRGLPPAVLDHIARIARLIALAHKELLSMSIAA